jgi:hypothetical protein
MAWIKRLLQSTGDLRIGDDFGSLLAPARARNLPLPETPEGATLATSHRESGECWLRNTGKKALPT